MRGPALVAALVLPLGAGLAACGAPTSGLTVEQLWREHCVSCHGADGRGSPARRGIEPRVDLTRSELVAGATRGTLYQRIAYGYATMPGFSHKLERGDIEMLVEWVLELEGR